MRNAKMILMALLVMFFSAGVMACGGGSEETVDDEYDEVVEQPDAEAKSVTLYKYKFNPTNLTVPAGTTVKFSNKDPDGHNVNIPALNIDQNLAAGESFEYTFDTTGEFAVSNRLASNPMQMTIVVE